MHDYRRLSLKNQGSSREKKNQVLKRDEEGSSESLSIMKDPTEFKKCTRLIKKLRNERMKDQRFRWVRY